jgi:hypothetical protein
LSGEEGGATIPSVGEPALSEPGTIKLEPETIKSEPTPPPPPPEPWCAKYAVPPVYRNADDGEWARYQAAIQRSGQEAGVVILDVDNDDDDAGE